MHSGFLRMDAADLLVIEGKFIDRLLAGERTMQLLEEIANSPLTWMQIKNLVENLKNYRPSKLKFPEIEKMAQEIIDSIDHRLPNQRARIPLTGGTINKQFDSEGMGPKSYPKDYPAKEVYISPFTGKAV